MDPPDMDPEERKLLALIGIEVLRKKWQEESVIGEPHGDRVFVRWIDASEDEPGWDDWRLHALIRQGEVEPLTENILPALMQNLCDGISRGEIIGQGQEGNYYWQWVRSFLAGPLGLRVRAFEKNDENP